MRMVKWMNCVSMTEHKTSKELREIMSIKGVVVVLSRARLRWLGHVVRKNEYACLKNFLTLKMEQLSSRGRPRMTGRELAYKDL